MKKINLFDMLSQVDPAYIDSTLDKMTQAEKPIPRLSWKYLITVAAVLSLIVATVVLPFSGVFRDKTPPVITSTSFTEVGETTIPPSSTGKPDDTTAPPASTTKPGDTTTPPSSTTKPGVTYPETYPSQLKGFETEDDLVGFLYVEGGNGTYTADSIWVDPDSIDLDDVDMEIITRNSKIQEMLGVEIYSFTNESLGIGDLQSEAKEYFDTQSDELDVYCGVQYYDISVATSGNLVNLNTLVNDNGEKLIDIEKPYWAGDYIKELTYGDHLYWVTGDLALRYTGNLYCTFINLEHYKKYVQASYGNRSIYRVAQDGDWTIGTMLDMAALFYDGYTAQNPDSSDVYGIVYENNDAFDGLAFGCGVNFSTKTEDEISITLGIDTSAAELAGYLSTMRSAPYSYRKSSEDDKGALHHFDDQKALITFGTLIDMAELNTSVAILPSPKLKTEQENYLSGISRSVTVFGISKYSNCQKTAAATLELMSFYSGTHVTPTFIESILKGVRSTRDVEDALMVSYMRQGVTCDFAAAWAQKIGNIDQIYREEKNCNNWKDAVTSSSQRVWPKELSNLLEELKKAKP